MAVLLQDVKLVEEPAVFDDVILECAPSQVVNDGVGKRPERDQVLQRLARDEQGEARVERVKSQVVPWPQIVQDAIGDQAKAEPSENKGSDLGRSSGPVRN